MDETKTLDLRLGWLDTFLSVAHHLDYQAAATELGIPAARVRKRIRRLEAWLGQDLIDPDAQVLSLRLPFAERFMLSAIEVLTLFDAACRHPIGKVPLRERSLVRLADLQAFLVTARFLNYDLAARNLGQSTGNVRRTIHNLERVLGRTLITGRMWLTVAPQANDFVSDAGKIVSKMQCHRLQLNDHLYLLYRISQKCKTLMFANISIWRDRKRISRVAARNLRLTESKINNLDKIVKCVMTLRTSQPTRLARDIDMDAFFVDRDKTSIP